MKAKKTAPNEGLIEAFADRYIILDPVTLVPLDRNNHGKSTDWCASRLSTALRYANQKGVDLEIWHNRQCIYFISGRSVVTDTEDFPATKRIEI